MGMEKEKRKEQKLKELKKKLKECQKLKDDYLAGWQRARADFLNYKKGELKMVSEILKYANKGLILEILPILDNFEVASSFVSAFAKASADKKATEDKEKFNQIIKGFLKIKIQLENFLKDQGLEKIEAVGKKFDPAFHEVVEEADVKDKESGIVLKEVQKGYKLHGKLLRPAKVKISK